MGGTKWVKISRSKVLSFLYGGYQIRENFAVWSPISHAQMQMCGKRTNEWSKWSKWSVSAGRSVTHSICRHTPPCHHAEERDIWEMLSPAQVTSFHTSNIFQDNVATYIQIYSTTGLPELSCHSTTVPTCLHKCIITYECKNYDDTSTFPTSGLFFPLAWWAK